MTKIISKSFAVTAVLTLFATVSVAGAAGNASMVPSCEVSVTPSSITSAQSATLKWDATDGAIFTSIDNGIGPVGVDGSLTVSPNASTVYTIKTWNSQGEGGTCNATLIVDGLPVVAATDGQPVVTLQTIAIHPASTKVVLSNLPYTGSAQSVVYTLFLLVLMLTAGYVALAHNKLLKLKA